MNLLFRFSFPCGFKEIKYSFDQQQSSFLLLDQSKTLSNSFEQYGQINRQIICSVVKIQIICPTINKNNCPRGRYNEQIIFLIER